MWSDYFPEYYGGFGHASAPWNESSGSGGGSWIPKETIPGGGNPYGLFAPSDANPTWPQYDPSLSPWDWGPLLIPNWPGGGGGGPMPVPEPPSQPTLPIPPAVPPPMPEPSGVPTYRTEGTAQRPSDTRDKVTAAAAGGSLAAAIAGILRGSRTGRAEDNPIIRTSSPPLPGDQPAQPPSVPPVVPPELQPQIPDDGVPTYSVTKTESRQTGGRTTPPVMTRADIPYEPVAIKPPGIFPPIITDAPTPPVLEEPVIPPPVLPPVTDPVLPGPPPTTPTIPKLPELPGLGGVVGTGSGAPLPGPFAPLVGSGPTQSVFQNNYKPSPIPSIGELLAQFAQIYGGR